MVAIKCYNHLYRFNNGICRYVAEEVTNIINNLMEEKNKIKTEEEEAVEQDLEWGSENSAPKGQPVEIHYAPSKEK